MGHPRIGLEMAELVQYYGTGRRKSSVARVFLRPGSGEFTVNGKPFDVYFVTEAQRIMAKSSLVLTETSGSFNIVCTVDGGGVNGQAGAVRMGTARALQEFKPELRAKLKADKKTYWHYTGYPGGIRGEEYKKRFERKPTLVVEDAIKGMLPHTKLGRAMFSKLKVYKGDKHPHVAQKPQALEAAAK